MLSAACVNAGEQRRTVKKTSYEKLADAWRVSEREGESEQRTQHAIVEGQRQLPAMLAEMPRRREEEKLLPADGSSVYKRGARDRVSMGV